MNETNRVDEDSEPQGGADPLTEPNGNKPGARAPEVRGARRGRPEPRGLFGRRAVGLRDFFTRDLWSRELASLPTFRRWWYGVARVAHLTATNFVKDRCTWRAAALTYITVLSLVPMLALGFSVAKGLGAYETLLTKSIVPFLDSTFGPADAPPLEISVPGDVEGAAITPVESGDAGSTDSSARGESDGLAAGANGSEDGAASEPVDDVPVAPSTGADTASETEDETDGAAEEIDASPSTADEPPARRGGSEVRRAIDTVLGFVQETDVSRLGVFGLLIVIYTVVQLLSSIERSFNDIWGVSKSRSLPRKLADYLSTVVLVPLLLVTGTGVLSLARSGWLSEYTGREDSPLLTLISSFAICVGFGFAYILMPNTRTRVLSALVGGIVGGTMWQLFQFAHTKLQIGVANYNAIYSTFAALPIFLFWVHSSWMTVLLGAEAAAAHQNQARHGQLVRSRDFDLALKETIALRVAARITRTFLDGGAPLPMDDLADELGCPDRTLKEVAEFMERAHILVTVEPQPDEPALVLAADPDRVRLQHVLDALKGDSLDDEDLEALGAFQDEDERLGAIYGRFRKARDAAAENATLRQLAEPPV